MKERQRWRSEEDTLLRAYVKQYGPHEWNLVSQRMKAPLNRDAKSCLERWKNYLKPGIKKESLTEEEQRLVIRLQAKYGNKWKKIAAEIPGRTAKRLGKWWEVFKEKQQRQQKESGDNKTVVDSIETGKYDQILETFAEKIVKDLMTNPASAPNQATARLPPWLSSSSVAASPSVTLSLASSMVAPASPPPVPWMGSFPAAHSAPVPIICTESSAIVSELVECCRDLDEGHRAWASHKKEAAWRLRRVELQLESEKACRRREKMEEVEAKVKALRDEQQAALERIEAEYREQLMGLRRDAEAKEQKLAEQWAAKHSRLTKFLEQMGCQPPRMAEPNGR